MITYTARDHNNQLVTIRCSTRAAALDLVESDLLNGVTPIQLEIFGVQLSLPYIMALVTKRWTRRGNSA
jgi:hypothetical protein